METQVLACIIDIFFIGTQHILFKQFLGKKYKNKLYLTAGWSICFMLWQAGGNLSEGHKLLYYLYAWCIDLTALCTLYRGHTKTKIGLMNCIVLLRAAAEGTAALLFTLPVWPAKERYFVQSIQPGIRSIISQLFFFLFVKIVLAIFIKQIQMKSADWFELFLVPAGSIAICYAVCHVIRGNNGKDPGGTEFLQVMATVLTVMNLQAYYEHRRLKIFELKDMKNELMRQQMESLRLQYEGFEKQWERLCVLRHNMANHYALEMEYLEKGQYNMLLEYCGERLGEIKKPARIVNTGNIGIDSILNYKLEAAGKYQIKAEYEIELRKEVTVSDIDLNILIGNLFDNAVEAVKKLDADKRKLYIAIKADDTTFFLEINNPYAGQRVKDCKGNFPTRKKDKAFHGLGLKEVKRMVKKYHGKMAIDTGSVEFSVKVFIYMQAKGTAAS